MSKSIDPKSMLMGWLMGRQVVGRQHRAEAPTAVYGYQDFETAHVKLTRDTYEDYPGGSIPLSGQHLYNGTEMAPGLMLSVRNSYDTIKAAPMARLGDRVRILFCVPEIETALIDWKLVFQGEFDTNAIIIFEPRIQYDPATGMPTELKNSGGDVANVTYSLVQLGGVDYVSMTFTQGSDWELLAGVSLRIDGTKPDGLDTPVAWRFPVEDPVRVEVTYNHVTAVVTDCAEVSVAPGGQVQLSAQVLGVGGYDRSLTWRKTISILGGIEVDEDGLVTVATGVGWTSCTIRATSVQDSRYYVDFTINLTKESAT